MARYIGPKDKLSRREGFDLFGTGNKLTRLAVPPGQHGPKGTARVSEYGRQLREKQKTKRLYGILERQFENYVKKAQLASGNTGEELMKLLERRLDNVIYRLKFAPSRPAARQLVSHGHIFVNNKKVTIPSYSIKVGDVISLSPSVGKIPQVVKLLAEENLQIPSWLKREGKLGKVDSLPKREDLTEPIDEHTIVEFYSR